MSETRQSILKLRLQAERHVVHARQRARDIAGMLGFERLDQVRLATATSELARNAFRYAREGTVEFFVTADLPQSLLIEVRDEGPGIENLADVLAGRYQSQTGLGKGLTGTRKLMDRFEIASTPQGTRVLAGKVLQPLTKPVSAAQIAGFQKELARTLIDPIEEVDRQNQDLLRTLAELREKQEQLAQVNSELEDTNRGVVALYAELEQNANDLRRVSDQKTSFLSNLSHEFRTPLNAILALCQILNSRADGDMTAEQERQVGYIHRSASDLNELVNDLLDVAKVEAGKVDIKPAEFSVTELFGALRGLLRPLLTSSAVELIFSAPDDLPALYTDEQKLSQVLRNLISNALKFTQHGHVTVTAEAQGEHILFRVEDTGIGIAPEDHERVFEEFVQIGGAIQSRVRGTGLGLPLARRLSELMGGTLTMHSAIGTGSTFTVVLPMRFSDLPAPTRQPEPKRDGSAVVLIVEDNPETRFIHQSSLRLAPYTLQLASSLSEAHAMFAERTPDAIVLDRMLDGQDSLGWVRELRGSGYRGRVICVSVMDDEHSVIESGADAFLLKPVAPGLLADTLAELLGTVNSKPLLLVDDDEINRYVLREALLPFGFKLLEARTGREALQIAATTALSGVFLDMSMPGLTGLETLRELKGIEGARALPVVIHTSKDLTTEEVQAIEHLGGSLFPKSALSAGDVHKALHALLNRLGIV